MVEHARELYFVSWCVCMFFILFYMRILLAISEVYNDYCHHLKRNLGILCPILSLNLVARKTKFTAETKTLHSKQGNFCEYILVPL